MPTRLPRRSCLCGCGRLCKSAKGTYATPQCVPRAVRSAGGRKGRVNYAYQRRRIFFAEALARLTADGRSLTTERILGVFDQVYDRGWQTGYHAAEGKWLARTGGLSKRKVAA